MTTDLTIDQPPLRQSTMVSYGVGAVASGVAFTALAGSVLQYYLNQVVRLPAILVGTALLVSLIVDAAIDPLIGQWSDNFRSPLGRRHPFMYASAFLAAVSFYFLWHAPQGLSGVGLLGFMLMLLIALRVSMSLYEIPSNALIPELAPDYDLRTILSSYRFFFFVVAWAAMSFLLQGVFLRKDAAHPLGPLNRDGYAAFGLVGAVAVFIVIIVSSAATQGRVAHLHRPPRRAVNLALTLREVIATIANPSLLVLLACGLFGGVAAGMRAGLDLYFYIHLWGLPQSQIAIILPTAALGSFVAVFSAPFLSAGLGKKMTMIVLFIISTVSGLIPITLKLFGLMPANGTPWVIAILLIDAVVAGTLAIMGLIIIGSMVADVVEDNAIKTGVRAEGVLFATNGLVPKFTGGIGAFMAGLLVTLVKFPTHAVQGTVPPELMRHLVLLFLPTYAVLVSISIGVLFFYKIDRKAHEHNLEQLRQAASLAGAELLSEAGAGVSPLDRRV